MPAVTRTFRVFVSSTFEDLKQERDALQRRVFPELRKRCETHHARFQAIDLRWGVRDEAALDQKTMDICLCEIERCQRTAIKPNFIVLLGQRYGWRPLPARIEAREFEAIRERVPSSDGQLTLVGNWYQRDDNAVQAQYLLRPREGKWVDPERWRVLESYLHLTLLDAARVASLSEQALIKYETSATHQEILKGLGSTPHDRQHVFAFCRQVPDHCCDPDLTKLKSFLRAQLPAGNMLEYDPDDHEKLCQDVERTLSAVIDGEAAGFMSRPALSLEMEAHDVFARERALVFGRDDALDAISDYLHTDNHQPLVLHGASGSGKSAVMAQASEGARARFPSAVVVRRFIGTTPDSSTGLTLLGSLLGEIGAAYPTTGDLPVDFDGRARALRERFALATAQRPLVVFLDALDQLGKDDPARSLAWIGEALPTHCRIVVSATDHVPGFATCQLELGALSREGAAAALDHWLDVANRRLQPPQKERLLAGFSRCGLPLYLKLAFEEARGWTSHLPPDRCLLGEGVEGVIGTLLRRLSLESNHGPLLLSRSLGYLGAARHGLAEDEMLQLLSADRDVRDDFIRRSPTERAKPESERLTVLPVLVWSRLHFDLEPYLTERMVHDVQVIAFYHPQLQQVAKAYGLNRAARVHLHVRLGHLFERACKDSHNTYLPRKRAIAEVAYHHRMCNNRRALRAIYTNMSYVCAFVRCHSPFTLKEELEAVATAYVDGEVRAFIGNAASLLARYPDQAPQLIYKELTADSFRQQAERLATRPWIRADHIGLQPRGGQHAFGVSPKVSLEIHAQASCVAVSAHLVFIHSTASTIALLGTDDLRPRGEIALPVDSRSAIRTLLADRRGGLLALVYDSGEIEVRRTIFSPSGTLSSTIPVHRGTCMTGRFGAIAACACLDDITYQAPDRRVVSLHLDSAGELCCEVVPADGKILLSTFTSNMRSLMWREGKEHLVAFPEFSRVVSTGHRALATCQLDARVAVSTEDGRLLIYRLPTFELEQVIACRLPILSISPTSGGVLLMTDRHGNILSLDAGLAPVDHGRCSQDLLDDYPSAVYPAGVGAFYISQRRCVTLSLGAASERGIVQVDGDGDHCNLLRYSRAGGFELSFGAAAPRQLVQEVVGHRYEFEFSKFRVAWSPRGTVAYTRAACTVALEDGVRSWLHTTGSDIVKIVYQETLDAFLVLCSSGVLHVLAATDGPVASSIQLAKSDTGIYHMEGCGEYVCVVALNVLCRPAGSNAYSETVLSLHRLVISHDAFEAELVDLQHVDGRQAAIAGLSYHRASNSLYLLREGTLERWQLDEPQRRNVTRVSMASERNALLQFCAGADGAFYVDTSNRLTFQPMTPGKGTTKLASFRTMTFLGPATGADGYVVEDSQEPYRFGMQDE